MSATYMFVTKMCVTEMFATEMSVAKRYVTEMFATQMYFSLEAINYSYYHLGVVCMRVKLTMFATV